MNSHKLRALNSSKIFFVLNSLYYFVQLSTFLYISSLALPKDIGVSSYVISLAGIFAVIARYGMPVYLIESINDESSKLDEYFKTATAFSFSTVFLILPFSFLVIINNTFSSDFILLMIVGTFLMILFNPISMIIEQLIILKKQTQYLSLNSILKTIFFPITAFFTYQFTDSFAATIIFANLSILLAPLFVYFFFERSYVRIALDFSDIKTFVKVTREAFPYFINSLALILILSIDKIFVGNIFSVEILGSYDLMWKLAILIDFALMQPLNALFSRDILNISNHSGFFISSTISALSLALVLVVNLIDFNFVLPIWNMFFEKYEFNSMIFKLSISFFILMFAVNQIRNLMANLKLRLMCTLSSCIIPMPLILSTIFFEIQELTLIPTLIVTGVFISLIFNLSVYNYFKQII